MNAAQDAILAGLADELKKELLALASASKDEAAEALKTLASDAADVATTYASGGMSADQAKHDFDLLLETAKTDGLILAAEAVQAEAASALKWAQLAITTAVKIALA